jgi:hypothetical protein
MGPAPDSSHRPLRVAPQRARRLAPDTEQRRVPFGLSFPPFGAEPPSIRVCVSLHSGLRIPPFALSLSKPEGPSTGSGRTGEGLRANGRAAQGEREGAQGERGCGLRANGASAFNRPFDRLRANGVGCSGRTGLGAQGERRCGLRPNGVLGSGVRGECSGRTMCQRSDQRIWPITCCTKSADAPLTCGSRSCSMACRKSAITARCGA